MDWHSQNMNEDKENTKKLIIESLRKINSGDTIARDEFIVRFKPFILKLVYKVTDKYIEPENSEEYSVALLAFNEAINTYEEKKHPNFLAFSEQVINRRLIDYKRKSQKYNMVYPFSYFETDDRRLESSLFEPGITGGIDRIEFTEEISLFKDELASFNISFKDLLLGTPKHKDSRELLIKIAKTIAGDEGLYEKLRKKRRLPTPELLKLTNVSRRTLERNKKYIIAVSLILRSSLEIFKEYAECSKERGADLR